MTRSGIIVFICALLLQTSAARVAQLGKEDCAKFKGEQELMEKAGVRSSMAKGAQWAKANLAPDQLDQVRRLIELDEQLLFRCGGKPLVELPVEIEADPAAVAAESKDSDKEPAGATEPAPKASSAERKASGPETKGAGPGADKGAKVKKKAAAVTKGDKAGEAAAGGEAKDKADTKAKGPGKAEPGKTEKATAAKTAKDAGGEPAPPKARPKAKAKADDAYRPPPGEAGTNPFAGQPAPPAKN